MNSSIGHKIKYSILETINKHFERMVVDKYKEPHTVNYPNENPSSNPSEKSGSDNVIEYGIEDIILDDEIITNPLEFNETGDILNCDTVSVFYNNTIASKVNNLDKKYEPIIKAGTLTFAIEDMIDIEEQEDAPIGKSNSNSNDNVKKITISNPEPPTILVNHLENQSNPNQSTQSNDAFADLMKKIPMKGKDKAKRVSPKSSTTATTTLETLLNTVATNSIDNAKLVNTNVEEDLKPIGKYNLLELQMLAKLYKIDTRKQGSAGKMINKTKQEMYDEIQEKMNKN
jgi:hypothetical protein